MVGNYPDLILPSNFIISSAVILFIWLISTLFFSWSKIKFIKKNESFLNFGLFLLLIISLAVLTYFYLDDVFEFLYNLHSFKFVYCYIRPEQCAIIEANRYLAKHSNIVLTYVNKIYTSIVSKTSFLMNYGIVSYPVNFVKFVIILPFYIIDDIGTIIYNSIKSSLLWIWDKFTNKENIEETEEDINDTNQNSQSDI